MCSTERRRAATCLLITLLVVAAVRGQQVADVAEATTIRPAGPTYGMPDPSDPTRYQVIFLGGVEVEHGARHLHGDTLVISLRHDLSSEPIAPAGPQGETVVPDDRLLELFLDGHVTVTEGDERISEATTYHLDNTTGVATIVQGELHAPRAEGLPPLAARFDTLHRLQDGTLRMENFRYTNCPYGQPHWHVQTPWAELRETSEGRVLETGGNIIRVGEVPVFWLPGASTNLDQDDGLLLRRVSVGRSSRFGNQLLLEWGGDASSAVSKLTSLVGGPEKVDARWSMTTEYMSDRGIFLEPKLKYETKDSKGEIFASHIHDQADHDHLGQPIPDADRGRYDVQHRTHIDEHKTLDIEVSQQSDADYLKEYYEREFNEEKPQETYVSYRDVVDNRAYTLLESTRLNDFDQQVVYQPEFDARLVGEPLLGGFFSSREYISNAKTLPAENTTGPELSNLRIGTEARIDWPFDLPNGDRVRALVGGDLTWFDKTVDQGQDVRTAGAAGVDWSRSFHGTDSAAHDEDWNIDGLRRLAEVHVGYYDRYYVSTLPDELLQIDEIEQLAPVRAITLQWRDRLQTHQDGEVKTILDTDWLLPIYPDQERDNDGQTLGPLLLDARWKPGAKLPVLDDARFHWRTQQDLENGHYLESFASFNTHLAPDCSLHLSNNRAYHEFDFVTTAVSWQINQKWAVAPFYQVDQRTHDRVRSGLVLRQLAHCWYVDMEVSTHRGGTSTGASDNETQVSLRLTPAGRSDEDLAERIGGRYQ